MSDLFNGVVDIIHTVCGVEKDKIKLDSNLMVDLKIDSLDFLDITYEIDKKYDIEIPIEEWMEESGGQEGNADTFTMENLLQRVQALIDKKKRA